MLFHPGLFEAAGKGDCHRVEGLITAGHHPDTHRGMFKTTSIHAAADGGHIKCVELLVKAGGNLSATDAYDRTPLHIAVANNHLETARCILEYPLGKQCLAMGSGPHGLTPLALAEEAENAAMVRLLKQAGATIRSTSDSEGLCYFIMYCSPLNSTLPHVSFLIPFIVSG